jgi:hypothetical protein
MEPWLGANDKRMFYKYLDKATVYFEYGAGGSTYQANSRSNIENVYTVESDMQWLTKVKEQIPAEQNKIVFFYNEMDTRPETCGHPGPNSNRTQWINYSNQILNLSKEQQQKLDFVMIDGRFRVACCLKAFSLTGPDCLIAFDDFLNRKRYHIVLDYYDIVEKTLDERMVILRKKSTITSIPEDLIQKYEVIRD